MVRAQLICVLLVASACSDGSNKSNSDGGVDMRRGPVACMSDGQNFQLDGKYGVRALLEVNVKLPTGCTGAACIVNQDATAKLILLTDVARTYPPERTLTGS